MRAQRRNKFARHWGGNFPSEGAAGALGENERLELCERGRVVRCPLLDDFPEGVVEVLAVLGELVEFVERGFGAYSVVSSRKAISAGDAVCQKVLLSWGFEDLP